MFAKVPQNMEKSYLNTKNYAPLTLDAAFEYCQEIIEVNSKSFSFASSLLNASEKRDVAALYAFCRYVDDLVDLSTDDPEIVNSHLKQIDEMLDSMVMGASYYHPIFQTIGDVIQRHNIPIRYFHELVDGVRTDLFRNRMQTMADLENYCYKVASTVGLMMTHIFVPKPDMVTLSHAAALGKAMQITNILRDIREDYSMGRIYIPEDMMENYGIKEEDFAKESLSSEMKEVIVHLMKIARYYYKLGNLGLKFLPRGGAFSVAVASKVYAEILSQIKRKDYDVMKERVYVTKPRKLMITLGLKLRYGGVKSTVSFLLRLGR